MGKNYKTKKKAKKQSISVLSVITLIIASIIFLATGYANPENNPENTTNTFINSNGMSQHITLDDIPEYAGNPYIVINDNIPFFSDDELTTNSFENYSQLDSLGRCGVCTANIGKDLMPTEKRGEIGSVKPTGWQTAKYETVEGKYLYNRCHLIGYQLTAENANKQNLITGTRYLNVQGMLPFENMVADYIKETNNHVYYRVTPIFEENNLVANGVLMEAKSVEDNRRRNTLQCILL